MTVYGLTSGMSPQQQAMPTYDLLRESMGMLVISINASYPEGVFPPGWTTLSIDSLRAYYVNQGQIYFDQLMVQFETILDQFEIIGGFEQFRLKVIVDHIGDEVELIPGGPKGVPINLTIQKEMKITPNAIGTPVAGLIVRSSILSLSLSLLV